MQAHQKKYLVPLKDTVERGLNFKPCLDCAHLGGGAIGEATDEAMGEAEGEARGGAVPNVPNG